MKSSKLKRLGLAFLLVGLSVLAWSPARAATTCPDHMAVTIDIKPGSYPNSINLGSKGLLPVAVLTTETFDASQLTPAMAMLTDAASGSMDCSNASFVRYALKDVNGDGRPDLIFFFDTLSLNLTASTTAATLMAHGSYAGSTLHIMGTDSVNIVP